MAATGAPADEAIKTTQHLIDNTLDEVEKILLRLPPRRVTTVTSVVRTTEPSATMTAVSPATTTAHSSQLATAHSSEAKLTKRQSQSTSSTVAAMTPDAKTTVSPPTKTATSPVAETASSTREHHNRSESTSLTTAVSPNAKTAVSPPTKAATSPVAETASSTREQHNRSESASLTTAVSPMAKTAVSPMARTARFSGRRQRSHSASSAISQTSAFTSTGDVRTATTPSVCPNTAPLRPKSFVIPLPRTSTPVSRQVVQSSSSTAVQTAQSTSGDSTAVSPIAKTAHSPMARTAQSTAMASETSVFMLQGPVTVTSQENVIRRQDGMVNVNELIELRGAGATAMPTNELQPHTYSHAVPTSAKGAVDSKETVKFGDNVMHIQRSISINPAGPSSTQPSEYALKELRIYSQDGTAHEPTTGNSPAQLVRLRSEQEGGGVDIELNINVKRSKGALTTPAKIKCDCPGFIPSKVWVNDRQVWTAAGN
jgi:hypothetical protein